ALYRAAVARAQRRQRALDGRTHRRVRARRRDSRAVAADRLPGWTPPAAARSDQGTGAARVARLAGDRTLWLPKRKFRSGARWLKPTPRSRRRFPTSGIARTAGSS